MMVNLQAIAWTLMICLPALAEVREWRDVSGHFKIEAELVGSHDTKIVLKTTNGSLLALEAAQLCPADRIYVTSTEAKELLEKQAGGHPTPIFKLVTGFEVHGVVFGFAGHAWDIQRKNGSVYVNNVRFKKLPKAYRELFPALVNHFEEIRLPNYRAMEKWLGERGNTFRHYHADSVAIRTTDHEFLYLPLFMFSEPVRARFEQDFKAWKDVQEAKIDRADKQNYDRESSLRLQYKYQRELAHEAHIDQFRSIELGMLAIATGVTTLWEVSIENPRGYLAPFSVIVAAPNSAAAEAQVLNHYPGMRLIYTRIAAGL